MPVMISLSLLQAVVYVDERQTSFLTNIVFSQNSYFRIFRTNFPVPSSSSKFTVCTFMMGRIAETLS